MPEDRLAEALAIALEWHRSHERKGTSIPYVSHLMQVSGLVFEAGGDEEQAIAGLLHDAIEDAETNADAEARKDHIEDQFGARVLNLVLGCTDGDPAEKKKLSWRKRKERYLKHLRKAERDIVLVSLCDKVHNARAILHDLRIEGPALWGRFNAPKSGTLWYYRELARIYQKRDSLPYADEFNLLVDAIEREAERGSRKHLLDWVESSRFLPRMNRLLEPTGAVVSDEDVWKPTGWADAGEPKLHIWGPKVLPEATDWTALRDWWLDVPRNANVPNWDWAATCDIDGHKGLVLVEAKAHAAELKAGGKGSPDPESANSRANHERIGKAMEEARESLEQEIPGIGISRDQSYQLSNRVAHAWWVASQGIPVVLMYLGFLQADDVADVGKPFGGEADWQPVFKKHAAGVLPEAGLERWIRAGEGRFSILVRSVPRRWR